MPATDRSPSFLASPTLAGVLYLVIIVCGVGSEALVRGSILVPGDAAATAANLAAAQLPFRLSLLADVVMVLADVGLGVLLYFLFARVNQTLALMAMAFRLVQAAVLGANLLALHHAVTLVGSEALPLATRDAWVTTYLESHAAGYDMGLFFFGVDCLVVGALILRSGFVPRAIAPLMSAAGVVYLAGSTARFVVPTLADVLAPAYVVPLVAEVAFCGWLLVAGRKAVERGAGGSADEGSRAPAPAPAAL